EPQKVHWHEDAISTHESEPEVDLAQRRVHHPAKHFREPEISSREHSENGGHSHHQMKVSNYVVRRMQQVIHRRLRQKESGKPPGNEKGDKAQRKQHGNLKMNFASPKRAEPVKRLNRRGNSDRHRHNGEGKSRVWIHPTEEHVMTPNHEAEKADGVHGDYHGFVAEDRFAAERGEHVRGNSHAGENRNVHLRMTKEPEKVLPQER